MKSLVLATAVVSVVVVAPMTKPTAAYELITHARISQGAVQSSEGIQRYFDDTLTRDRVYPHDGPLDTDSAEASLKFVRQFQENDGTAVGWLTAGSIREDDYARNLIIETLGCEPSQNPPTAAIRMRNHFFDVQRGGRGLTATMPLAFEVTIGLPAPDWALGLRGRGTGGDENRYSILDSRAYQLDSLTAGTRNDRDRATARLFRSLGHVAHVLQDMAQPQHTRNDPHAGCLRFFGGGEHSWYELHIENRAKTNTLFLGEPGIQPIIPTFPRYRDHWTNAANLGLADFSSRQFLSAGTNFGPGAQGQQCSGLNDPSCTPDDPLQYENDVEVVTRTAASGTQITGKVEFFRRAILNPLTSATILVPDAVNLGSTVAKVRLSTRSLWDEQLRRRAVPVFSMNSYTYDEVAAALLPRAVEYSAGLLDYFFRGSLDIVFEPDADPAKVMLRAVNQSRYGSQPEVVRAGGTFTLYSENVSGDRSAVQTVTLPNDVGEGGKFPGISLDALAEVSPLIGVYRGPLGNEADAVVAKIHPAAEVEHLFLSGGDWRLRTADGVFPLGIGSGPAVVKWGDADNLIVAQTFVSGSNDRIFTPYRIKRPVGSRVVPLVNGVVDVETLGAPVRLGGAAPIDLGTTVKFKRKVTYSQQLVVLDVDSSNGGDRGFVVGSSSQIFDDYPPVVLDRTLALQMPITLPNPPQYLWTVLDFYLDRNGHVLVSVLAQLLGTTVQMPVRRFSDVTKELEDTTAVTFTVNLDTPTTRDIIFLVDVTTRSVVRDPNDRPIKSSEDTIDITYETIQQEAFVQFRDLAGNSYLPNAPRTDGTTAINPDPVAVLNIRHEIPAPPIMTGLFRPELASEGFGIPAVTVPQPTIQMTNLTGVSSIQSISTANVFSGAMGFQDMRRASASDNSFALIGSATPPGDTSGAHLWRPMFWSRATQSVTLLPKFETPVFSGASIADASRATMMIFVNRFAAPRFTHTHFSSAVLDLLVTSDLRTQYDLLEPNLLFNVTDRAFHRIIKDLPALPAPRPLVTGTNIPTAGQYHVNGR